MAAIETASVETVKLLAEIFIKGSALLIFTYALTWLLRKKLSASLRGRFWIFALAGVFLIPLVSLLVPSITLQILPDPALTRSGAGAKLAISLDQNSYAESAEGEISIPQISLQSEIRGETEGSATPLNWTLWISILWLGGTVVYLLWLLVGKIGLWWITLKSGRLEGGFWESLSKDISEGLGVRRRFRLLKSGITKAAINFGILRPKLILPESAEEWTEDRARVVLLHEFAHVSRWDGLSELLAQVALAIQWFNPIVWLAVAKMRAERERSCDDLVLNAGTKPSDYATQLMEVAADIGAFDRPLWQAAAISEGSSLKDRLLCILDPNIRRGAGNRLASGAMLVLVILSVTSLAAFNIWQQDDEQIPRAVTDPLKVNVDELPRLLRELSTDDAFVHAKAAYILSHLGEQAAEAAPLLIEMLADERNVDLHRLIESEERPGNYVWMQTKSTPKAEAAAALRAIGAPAVEALSKAALEHQNKIVREAAILTLYKIDGRAAGAVLARASVHADAGVRETAAEVGGEIDTLEMLDRLGKCTQRDIDFLINALSDKRARVRARAAHFLGVFGDSRALNDLIIRFEQDVPEVVIEAAEALGSIRDTRAVETLLKGLGHPDSRVRQMTVWALGEIGDPAAIEPLMQLLGEEIRKTGQLTGRELNENQIIKTMGQQALTRLQLKVGVEDLIQELSDSSEVTRMNAARHLGAARDPRAVDPLTVALRDPSADVRRWSAWALAHIADERALRALIAVAADGDADVRMWAAYGLGLDKTGDKDAIRILISMTRDTDVRVRRWATYGLGREGNAVAVDPLLEKLKDSDAEVRRWAARSLGEIGDASAIANLKAALQDGDPSVREAAEKAMAKLGEAK
ncbi:MAG TPA: M56 family metallopeptidase [Acidobacteriota bacterium]|nr:M56 family metallopeptidase [Acidobacteriota bacterium]